MNKSIKKDFNKGLNLLLSFGASLGVIYCIADLARSLEINILYMYLLTSILCAIILFKAKYDHFLLYPLLIVLLPQLGFTLYVYEALKSGAKKKGQNIDSPRGILFWIVVALLGVYILAGLYFIIINDLHFTISSQIAH